MQENRKRIFYALDLEMEQPSDEIISIGVAYQHFVDGKIEFSKHNFLITPSQPVSPFIQELTGLKDDMFDWSKSRKECFESFSRFHSSFVESIQIPGEVICHKEAIVWGAGDIALLRSQMHEQQVEHTIPRRFIDTKSLVMLDRFYSGKSISARMGLSSGLKEFGLDFEGNKHDSSSDAYNTLRLFSAVVEKNKKLNEIVSLAKNI